MRSHTYILLISLYGVFELEREREREREKVRVRVRVRECESESESESESASESESRPFLEVYGLVEFEQPCGGLQGL